MWICIMFLEPFLSSKENIFCNELNSYCIWKVDGVSLSIDIGKYSLYRLCHHQISNWRLQLKSYQPYLKIILSNIRCQLYFFLNQMLVISKKSHCYSGMIFFQLFNWFQLFFCERNSKSQNRSKMTFLKGGVDGFSYFQLFYFLSRINPGYCYANHTIRCLQSLKTCQNTNSIPSNTCTVDC